MLFDPNKTFTEEQLFKAILELTDEYTTAGRVLGMQADDPDMQYKFKPINDLLMKLGYTKNAYYIWLLSQKKGKN